MKLICNRLIHSSFFVVLLKKFDSVTVSLVGLSLGWFLIRHPRLVNYSEAYDIVSQVFTSRVFGFAFLLVSFLKILSIIYKLEPLKIITISILFGLWMFFGTALFLSDTTNTVYIHCYGWALVCLGVVLREMVE